MTMYPYEDMIAFTPYDKQVGGGVGQVFALGDVNFEAPLAAVDEYGNPVTLEANPETGYLPPFYVEDHEIVRFKSGQFTRTLTTVMPLPGPPGEPGAPGPATVLPPGEVEDATVAPLIADPASATRTALIAAIGDSTRFVDAPYRQGAVSPAQADLAHITGWGSSSIANLADDLTAMAGPLGVAYHDEGKSGERSTHIAARLGSVPAMFTVEGGTIPATGTVTLYTNTMTGFAWKTTVGTIAGVKGSIFWNGSVWRFIRATDGGAVTVSQPTPFIPEQGWLRRGDVTIFAMGKNDATARMGSTGIVDRINASVDFLAPAYKKVLIFGLHADNNYDTEQKGIVAAVNGATAARYGRAYIDVQGYVTSAQVWADTGITPTAADTTAQADGRLPMSLSIGDGAHFNQAAESALVRLIRARMSELGWYPSNPANPQSIRHTSDSFTGSSATNVAGRVSDANLGGLPLAWTISNPNTFGIAWSHLVPGSDPSQPSLIYRQVTATSVTISIKVTAKPTAGQIYLVARRDSPTGIGNQVRLAINSVEAKAEQYVNGTRNTFSAAGAPEVPYVAGDTLTLRVDPTHLTVWRNGNLEGRAKLVATPVGDLAGLSVDANAAGYRLANLTIDKSLT